MDIALCHQGENYSGVLVAIRSAVANCSDPQRLHFHVHSDLNDQSRDYIISSSGANVSFYPLNFNSFGSIKFAYPPIYYYRILLPEIHSAIERLLYIDTDIIVERDLLHLERLNADLDGAVGYGAIDNDSVRVSKELDIPYYVNSGFLYLNLTRARNVNFTERVLHRCDGNFCAPTGHDQAEINRVFSGSEIFPALDQTWNIQLPLPEALDSVPRGGRIVHITGPFKPWIYSCATIWWEVFRVYLPTDYPVPRAMPTNVVGFVFAGNALAQRSRYRSALLFFVLAAQHVLVKYGQDSEIGSRIVALSRIGLYEAYSNDLRAAVEAYRAYFESFLGVSRDEWNPYRYPGIL